LLLFRTYLRVLFNVFFILGLKLKETRSCGGAVIITGFSRGGENGADILQAEASGRVESGMLMLTVAKTVVFGRKFDEVCIYINYKYC
jgi:hypothetical protein